MTENERILAKVIDRQGTQIDCLSQTVCLLTEQLNDLEEKDYNYEKEFDGVQEDLKEERAITDRLREEMRFLKAYANGLEDKLEKIAAADSRPQLTLG